MSSINDESLLLEFVVESREHLSTIEPDMLILEREEGQTDPEIINRIFRAIHSIKGASGFFGLEALKRLSHSMESTLMMMRDGKLSPVAAVMDPLLVGVDRLRLMLDDIGNSETVTFQDVVEELEFQMRQDGQASAEKISLQTDLPVHSTANTEPKESIFHPDRLVVESAILNGQKLYAIQVFTDVDLAFQNRNLLQFQELLISTGNILDTALDISTITGLDKALNESLPLLFLYASVLEADLLAIALNIPETQFSLLQATDIFSEQAAAKPEKPPVLEAKSSMTEEVSAVVSKPETLSPQGPSQVKDAEPATKSTPKNNISSTESSNDSIRVKVDLLNRLMDLAGELVLARNQLTRSFEKLDNTKDSGLSTIIQNVSLVTSDLQEHIMQTRMQPIASIFGKFPRVIRDLSRHLNKEIELRMIGEEVELDKSILESLSDPLTHLIRNCCDHGMETPDAREAAGKPRQGTVLLKAYQESGHINIAVIDDGAGIDHERIAAKALEKGLVTEESLRHMTTQERVNLIFAPGFSTAEKVTDVSGRGVGMDVVRTNIEQIGGSISIDTEKGKGTTILLRLPLTLAIIPSLVVEGGGQTFAVPQINLVELVCVQAAQIATKIEKVGSAPVLRLRGKLLPLVKLTNVLGLEETYELPTTHGESSSVMENRRETIHDKRLLERHPNMIQERRNDSQSDYNILVLKSGNKQYGLIVDEIKDIEEIVVKPMSQFIKSCKCFSGATIMGNGRVAMVLDVGGVIATSGLSFSEISAEEERRNKELSLTVGTRSNQERQSVLLFNSASTEIFAIPLADILRLEKFSMSKVEKIGNRKFLAYQGKSISLLFLDDYLPVSASSDELDETFLILPACGEGHIGIVATLIIDTIDTTIQLEEAFIPHPGIRGSAVINDHVTLFLDSAGLLQSIGITPENQRSTKWSADHFQPSY